MSVVTDDNVAITVNDICAYAAFALIGLHDADNHACARRLCALLSPAYSETILYATDTTLKMEWWSDVAFASLTCATTMDAIAYVHMSNEVSHQSEARMIVYDNNHQKKVDEDINVRHMLLNGRNEHLYSIVLIHDAVKELSRYMNVCFDYYVLSHDISLATLQEIWLFSRWSMSLESLRQLWEKTTANGAWLVLRSNKTATGAPETDQYFTLSSP